MIGFESYIYVGFSPSSMIDPLPLTHRKMYPSMISTLPTEENTYRNGWVEWTFSAPDLCLQINLSMANKHCKCLPGQKKKIVTFASFSQDKALPFCINVLPFVSQVNVSMNLRNIFEVNEKSQYISLETSIRMYWVDPRYDHDWNFGRFRPTTESTAHQGQQGSVIF